MPPTRVLILGAGGRDFHNFNTVFRGNLDYEVAAFTATQIPDIADRTYPAELAGPGYPDGIPIHPEADLARLVRDLAIDEAVFAYSDVSHERVMHVASQVLASGAAFRLLGPRQTMLPSRKPVVAVCAVRSGAGKSPVSRAVAAVLEGWGLRVAAVRHPMPYGDLHQAVQRFAQPADLDRYRCTIEECEEYEPHLEQGRVVYAGVDYGRILAEAEQEADVILWDGGNNDFPFYRPDLLLVVADPLRAGDETRYHPGETCLLLADAVVINKADTATPEQLAAVERAVQAANPTAPILRCDSPVTVDKPELLTGKRVLVVEDGPTTTHGGVPGGAGLRAAHQAGATPVDPRPWAAGSIAGVYAAFPHIGPVLPAMGYSAAQRQDLQATIAATPCDAVLVATPIDLRRVVAIDKPVVRATYAAAFQQPSALVALLARFRPPTAP